MDALRQIPPVNDVLRDAEQGGLGPLRDQPFVSRLLDEILAETRRELAANGSEVSRADLTRTISGELVRRVQAFLSPSLRRVINATGVVIHTNLGRAPLPAAAIDLVREVSTGYSNLEFDLATGKRGRRDTHVAHLVSELIGAESAIVVNNNAAAVLLVLAALAEGGEVVASRGEQIEIGGSFRIPEVMTQSGARLHEVGTTNRTRIADYERAIGPDTRLMLRVHPSNFRVVGFTERPSLAEFVELGRRRGIPTFEDLGSGCMIDMSPFGIVDEPVPADSIRAGVDVVCFSGDKLMGGPQAGIIAGRREVVERIRRHPLFRALRVDKLTLAVLEVVLRAYLSGDMAAVRVWRMLSTPEDELRDRADALVRRVGGGARLVRVESVVGGGSAPGVKLPSWGLVLEREGVSPDELERLFRKGDPPVIVRIEEDRVLADVRTIGREEEDELVAVIEGILRHPM